VGLLHCSRCGFTDTVNAYRFAEKNTYPNYRTLSNLLLRQEAMGREPLRTLHRDLPEAWSDPDRGLRLHLLALAIQTLPPPEIRDVAHIGHLAHRLARFLFDRLVYGGPVWGAAATVTLPERSPLAEPLEAAIRRLESLKVVWPRIPLSVEAALGFAALAYGQALSRGFPGETPLRRLEILSAAVQVAGEQGDLERARLLLRELLQTGAQLQRQWEAEKNKPLRSLRDLDRQQQLEADLLRVRHLLYAARELSEELQRVHRRAAGA
jgi:hypothetical protein